MKRVPVMILAGWVALSVCAGDVFVAAAASLTEVMKRVQGQYAKERPDVKLVIAYGSTGMLRTQVLKGAPCDVFVGADRWFAGCATNMGEVVNVDRVRVVAMNTLVVVAGKGTSPKGASLSAWLDDATKVGIGNPVSVPAGRYAKKLLEHEALWEACRTKYVLGTNVREVLLWLRQGAVGVGFVYGSDLVAANDEGLRCLATYDAPGGVAIELAGGVAKNAKNIVEAQAFLDYLKTPEAVKVFSRCGFRLAK